jgi:hypothetical protein
MGVSAPMLLRFLMGWFSSDTIISVHSNALPLADPDDDALGKAIIGALLEEQQILPAITQLTFNGIGSKVNNMMRYARDYYTLGLPNGYVSTIDNIADSLVETAINDNLSLLYGSQVELNYITSLSHFHILLPWLVKTRGYDESTGFCTIPPETLVYPNPPGGPTGSYKYSGRTDLLVISDVTLIGDPGTGSATYRIDYTLKSTFHYYTVYTDWEGLSHRTHWNTTITTTDTEDTIITTGIAGYRIGEEYLVARYYPKDSGGSIDPNSPKYWYYDMSSGLYPTLEQPGASDLTDYMMPVVPLRYNNQDLCRPEVQDTPLYKTSKRMMNKIAVDIDEVAAALNSNSAIGDMDHAYIMFGINLQTTRNESIKYLTEFFDFLHDNSAVTQVDFNTAMSEGKILPENVYKFSKFTNPASGTNYTMGDSTIVNSDNEVSLEENGLDVYLKYNWIESSLVNGSIGTVGTATKELKTYEGDVVFWGTTASRNNTEIILKLQVSANVYKQVIVSGARIINNVYGKQYAIVTTVDKVINSADEDNFIIPMHYGVSRRLPLINRNALYLEAIHCIVQSIHFQEVKWYQKGIFKVFCSIVLVVVGGILTLFGQGWIGVPLMKAGVAMAFMEILTQVLPMDTLKILMYIYMVYSIYSLNWAGLIDGTATAAEYLMVVSMAAEVSKIPMQMRHDAKMKEFEGLEVANEAKLAELEEAEKALDTQSRYLDPGLLLDGIRYTPVITTTVEDFINSKIWNNAGTEVLNSCAYYHDNAKRLPDNSFIS